MIFTVLITPRAESDLLEAFEYIFWDSPKAAADWLEEIRAVIKSLHDSAERCQIAPDGRFLGEKLHHRIYKSHRIIFRIEREAEIVRVITVRHSAQQFFGE